ncbi:protein Mis18-alpha isoform X2 [Nematostella vectensis]|uniref:protein Mis18-alpha isoform X2 n=1 Tax=Nematostella vectensis TaxID=45351 RepID=UPI00138FAD05|nr:protein Mis18-alpha isoform X2 [Nematostella vectensis]
MADVTASVDQSTVSDRGQNASPETVDDILPIVFQCLSCQVILGDSFSWVCADQDLQVVVLSAVTSNVSIEEGLETSTDGQDIGSTFIPLRCKSCKSGIGRIYRTTPLELDMIRDVFSLDCSSIKSYELGTQAGKNSYKTADELLDIPTAKDLKNEILKLQSVVVSLNERLQSVEKVIPETDGIGISTINNDNNTYSERQPPHSLNNKRAYTEMEKKGTVHQNIKHSKRIRT